MKGYLFVLIDKLFFAGSAFSLQVNMVPKGSLAFVINFQLVIKLLVIECQSENLFEVIFRNSLKGDCEVMILITKQVID